MTVVLALAGALAAFAVGVVVGRLRAKEGVHRQQASVEASDLSLADVLDDHVIGVVVAGRDGRVVYRNRAAVALDGTHSGVLLDERVEQHLRAAVGGEPTADVFELFGPPKRAFELTAFPLRTGGGVVFVTDVSARRRLDQVRTDFVANISHELKTPIGALAVLAETLVDADDLATVRRLADRMLAESDRAARTIDDLMELSQIESGAERSHDSVRVADIIRGAFDRVTELARRREISVTTLESVEEGGASSGQMIVIGDRRGLVSALGNLVENAVKYSEPGSSVQVRARREQGWIDLSVVDHGVGIPQRDLDRIFERFYRVDRARSRTTGGTGLGLSIVRHVATNHGGAVRVTSVEGEGSTFVLRLPDGEASSASQTPTASREGVA